MLLEAEVREVRLVVLGVWARERDPLLEREREVEPDAMHPSYASRPQIPGIPGECPDIRNPATHQGCGVIEWREGSPRQ